MSYKDIGFDENMIRKEDVDLIDNPAGLSRQNDSAESKNYWYENHQLKFRLTDGSIDQFDFSKANISRKMFEAFWNLWQSDDSGIYTEEAVKTMYKELHGEGIKSPGPTVSNIRSSIISPKLLIRNKIEWQFNFKIQRWIFRIH